jgi:hypothetical protein
MCAHLLSQFTDWMLCYKIPGSYRSGYEDGCHMARRGVQCIWYFTS